MLRFCVLRFCVFVCVCVVCVLFVCVVFVCVCVCLCVCVVCVCCLCVLCVCVVRVCCACVLCVCVVRVCCACVLCVCVVCVVCVCCLLFSPPPPLPAGPPSVGPPSVLGLSCKAPAALGPPGLHTTAPNVHVSGPQRFKHHQNSTRRHPERDKKSENGQEREKSAKFWPPTLLPTPFRAHTLRGPHPSGRTDCETTNTKMDWPKMDWPKLDWPKLQQRMAQNGLAKNGFCLQISPSSFRNRRVHTTPPNGFNRIERPSHLQLRCTPEMMCAICSASIQCQLLQHELCGPFQNSCLLCLVHGGLGPPKHHATVSRLLCTPCRFWFQPRPSVALLERDVHLEKLISPKFQLKESLTSSVCFCVTEPPQTHLRLRPFRIQPQSRQKS